MSNNAHKRSILIVLLTLFFVSGLYILNSFAETTTQYLYFPSIGDPKTEDSALNLALTAPKGNEVSMTYTPSTYEIRRNQNSEYTDLQIHGAALSGSLDTQYSTGHEMDLLFNGQGDWKVGCVKDNLFTELVSSKSGNNRVLLVDNQCEFNELWSGILRVYPGSTDSITMKTVWDVDENGSGGDINERELGLINVFRFRTVADTGTIGIAKTNTSEISDIFLNVIGNGFKTLDEKTQYESSLNWTTLYNTSQSAEFVFSIDVKNKSEVILFDKDADANKLYGSPANPLVPDDNGVSMTVRWGNGDPLTTNPEWTDFNQENHNGGGFKGANYVAGETNSYVGPSGDARGDDQENNAIQWYKIDVSEQKSDTITVKWHRYSEPSNGLAFASDTAVLGGAEEEEDKEEDDDKICELGEDGELDEDCCTKNEIMSICVEATPVPETKEMKKKGITDIDYLLRLHYFGSGFVNDLIIAADSPEYVEFENVPGKTQHNYNIGTFAENQRELRTIEVKIKDDAPDEGTITTLNKYIAKATGMTDLPAPTVRHYLGVKTEDEEPCPKPCTDDNGTLRYTISAQPPSETDNVSGSITYTIILENISDEDVSNVSLDLKSPSFTDFSQGTDPQSKIISVGQINKGATSNQTVAVTIRSDAPAVGTISTKDKYVIKATGMSDFVIKELRHFLGDKPIDDDNDKPCIIENSDECTSKNDDMEAKIFSDPKPETEQLVQKGITEITYSVTMKNIGDRDLTNVFIDAKAPEFVDFKEGADPEQQTIDVGALSQGATATKSFTVTLEDSLPDEGTITTKDRFFVKATEMTDLKLKPINHYLAAKPDGPGAPKCGTDSTGTIESCIYSTPANETKGMSAGESITYHVKVKNVSASTTLNDVNVSYTPDAHTKVGATTASAMVTESGQPYAFVGPGRTTLITQLSPGQETSTDIQVSIQSGVPEHYTISTNNKIVAAAANHGDTITLPAQKHHVGNGSEAFEVTRCYEFDGALDCSDTCKDVPQEASVIVRDLLKNVGGGSIPAGTTYFPPPLSGAFTYNSSSIRIFHENIEAADDIARVLGDVKKGIGGITVSNDGATFPPVGGIATLTDIPVGGSASVFFQYEAPKAPGCFPEDGESISPNPDEEFTEVKLAKECTGPDQDKICVGDDDGPRLTGELTSIPLPGSTVYEKTIITYELRLSLANSNAVKNITIPGIVPQNTSCRTGSNCTGKTSLTDQELQNRSNSMYYTYSVQVDEDLIGGLISHPGYVIQYSGEEGGTKSLTIEGVSHPFKAHITDTKDFTHQITLTRPTVVASPDTNPRVNDDADETHVIHEMQFKGVTNQDSSKEFVYPYINNGTGKGTEATPNSVEYSQHCTDAPFTRCSRGCSGYRNNSRTQRLFYDANKGDEMIVYRNTLSDGVPVKYMNDIVPAGERALSFNVSTTLPDSRPELIKSTSNATAADRHLDEFDYLLNGASTVSGGVKPGVSDANYFLFYGGTMMDDQNGRLEKDGTIISAAMRDTIARAIKDGETDDNLKGKVTTSNKATVYEEIWALQKSSELQQRISCEYTVCGKKKCVDYDDSNVPAYWLKWHRIGFRQINEIVSGDTDVRYVTSLTSVSWLKTRNGNLGFGQNAFSASGTPNKVDLGDQIFDIEMKLYTPPSETNSDFLIYAPNNSVSLKSRLPWGGYVSDSANKQGFIANPHDSEKRIPRRGDAYDRDAFARDYYEDLLQREIYGKVRDVASDRPGWINPPSGNAYSTGSSITTDLDTIYHVKGNLTIGSIGIDTIISGGKARIVVDGNVEILGNVRYSSHSGSSLDTIPSLRLHALGNIVINPSVTDVELMMLAENEFHSGRSDQQLRILGDVITFKAFWERTPLKNQRDEDEDINKPAELVVEDYRKYLLTPPGDKKLPDIGYMWREVNPSTGRPILEKLLGQ